MKKIDNKKTVFLLRINVNVNLDLDQKFDFSSEKEKKVMSYLVYATVESVAFLAREVA